MTELRLQPAVVVTGIGAVSGYGLGVAALWRGLAGGRTSIREVTRFDVEPHRTRVAAEVPGDVAPVRRFSRGASLADRFGLAAADEALAHAGLADGFGDRRVGVYFGCSTGGTFETEFLLRRLDRRPRPAHLAPTPCPPNRRARRATPWPGPSARAARRGPSARPAPRRPLPSATPSTTCAAARSTWRWPAAPTLSVSSAFAGFDSRAVDPSPCRPFRADREGMSIGEGAAMLVLERQADAVARGARPLARLLGAGASCDAHHMTAPDPSGLGVARAIHAALADAGLEPAQIDFVNAHGTGTPLNDAAEWAALAEVFGERAGRIPVASTKGAVGHLLGSAGAIEAVAAVLCDRARRPSDPRRRRRGPAGPRRSGAGPAAPGRGRGDRSLDQLRLRRRRRRRRPRGRRVMSRVVVTGVGWVGSHGAGRDALTAALAAGQPATVEVDRSAGHHRPSGARLAALVPAESLAPLVPAAAAQADKSCPVARLAVARCALAFADAGLDGEKS